MGTFPPVRAQDYGERGKGVRNRDNGYLQETLSSGHNRTLRQGTYSVCDNTHKFQI